MEQTEGDRQSEGSSSRCWRASMRCRASSTMRARSRRAAGSMFEELGLQMETRPRSGWRRGASSGWPATSRRPSASSGGVRRTRRSRREVRRFDRGGISRADAARARRRWRRRAPSATGAASSTTEADVATQALWRYVRGTDPRPAGRGRRGGDDRPRGDRGCSTRPTRSCTRSRLASRSARPSPPAADRRGARRLRERARPRGAKGGVVILTGVLRRLEDLDAARTTRERLGHQFQGPLVGAWR